MPGTRQQRPPFRAEHLGSLLRPDKLLAERHAMDSGKGDEKKLAAVTKESIDEIVKEQLDLGFHAVSDGEYPRLVRLLFLVPKCYSSSGNRMLIFLSGTCSVCDYMNASSRIPLLV